MPFSLAQLRRQGERNALMGRAIQGPNPQQVAQFAQQQALASGIQAGATNPFAAARAGAGAATGALLQQQMQTAQANERARSFAAQRQMQEAQFNQQRTDGIVRDVVGGAGRLLGGFLSDERAKQNVQETPGAALDRFMQSLQPSSFEMRPGMPGQENGQQTGVMAQDLMQSDVGRQMVQQGPSGMMQVDAQQALQTSMATIARIEERLRALEGVMPTNTLPTQGG